MEIHQVEQRSYHLIHIKYDDLILTYRRFSENDWEQWGHLKNRYVKIADMTRRLEGLFNLYRNKIISEITESEAVDD